MLQPTCEQANGLAYMTAITSPGDAPDVAGANTPPRARRRNEINEINTDARGEGDEPSHKILMTDRWVPISHAR